LALEPFIWCLREFEAEEDRQDVDVFFFFVVFFFFFVVDLLMARA